MAALTWRANSLFSSLTISHRKAKQMLRFTLIFAVDIASRETITGARFAQVLARLAPCHEIDGFTVWPSYGWTVEYGREAGATLEFIALPRNAVTFAADVCKHFGQDSVYLANGSDAVLVDWRANVGPLTDGRAFAGASLAEYNVYGDK